MRVHSTRPRATEWHDTISIDDAASVVERLERLESSLKHLSEIVPGRLQETIDIIHCLSHSSVLNETQKQELEKASEQISPKPACGVRSVSPSAERSDTKVGNDFVGVAESLASQLTSLKDYYTPEDALGKLKSSMHTKGYRTTYVGCIEYYTKTRDPTFYHVINNKKKSINLSRLAVMAFHSEEDIVALLTKEKYLWHLCANKNCFNPTHLVVETRHQIKSRTTCPTTRRLHIKQRAGVDYYRYEGEDLCHHHPKCIIEASTEGTEENAIVVSSEEE